MMMINGKASCNRQLKELGKGIAKIVKCEETVNFMCEALCSFEGARAGGGLCVSHMLSCTYLFFVLKRIYYPELDVLCQSKEHLVHV